MWNEAGILTFRELRSSEEDRSVTMGWYDDGIEQYHMGRESGALHGSYETWYESGQRRVRGTYSDGRRVGTWQCWNGSGQETATVAYDQEGVRLSRSVPTADWMAACTRANTDCARPTSTTDQGSQHACGRHPSPRARPSA